jgi:hypothetical protein
VKKTKLRPFGHVTLDHEVILEEMTDAHEMQADEILALTWQWIVTHRPGSIPVYVEDGSWPVFRIGPRKESDETNLASLSDLGRLSKRNVSQGDD